MRTLLCVLLLPLVAAAAPRVRWIDRLGDVHEARLAEVLADDGGKVRGRLAEGGPFEVDLQRVLTLIREQERVPRERALLRARLDASAGVRLDEARPVLDGILADADAPAWMREYAAAGRAILAEQAREKNAAERVAHFLEEHPRSRFTAELIRARARIAMRAVRGNAAEAIEPVQAAQKEIEKRRGPLLQEYMCLYDAAEYLLTRSYDDFSMFAGNVADKLLTRAEELGDLGTVVLVRSVNSWIVLLHQLSVASDVQARGLPPHGPVTVLRRQLSMGALDELPETRCDLELALGRLLAACGDADAAREAFQRALKLATDPRRREAASNPPPKK